MTQYIERALIPLKSFSVLSIFGASVLANIFCTFEVTEKQRQNLINYYYNKGF